MNISKARISLYAILIFVSGVAVGWFGLRLYTVNTVNANTVRSPEEWRKKYTAEMQGRLHLDGKQMGSLNSILDETHVRFMEARERMKPELDRIRSEQQDKIRAMLSDPQRAEYEKMRKEREEKEARDRAQGKKPPGP